MTPAEADQRIILSRRTLHDYASLAAVGVQPGPLDSVLISDEIVLLDSIAEDHPSKAAKIAQLVSQWVAFQDGMRAKLH